MSRNIGRGLALFPVVAAATAPRGRDGEPPRRVLAPVGMKRVVNVVPPQANVLQHIVGHLAHRADLAAVEHGFDDRTGRHDEQLGCLRRVSKGRAEPRLRCDRHGRVSFRAIGVSGKRREAVRMRQTGAPKFFLTATKICARY
ncbi:hypothetical protein SI859A1_00388 [Aurantimonas manganoxydans SI85-9A1]|uniref:Uncharacterized protein n=1 Tax=Aurantimonas manganoxydans (strain ATCC BAA-1229 / DSM 21871 / SI85-9A1) TaxID=287752 RepID=Q1YH51_AURMS|nr:hypothetical protein SI859A1_00388 [Aurantimonas manganoxydans SI85-9A1]